MSIVRWSPYRSLRWPDFWDDDDFSSLTSQASNNLDVYETKDEVVVKANVAGVKAEDVDITFEKGVLLVKAEATEEKGDEEKKHYSKSSWSYSYRVAVPGFLDTKVEPDAEVKDGVLTIKFKKAEEAKPKKLKVMAK